MSGKYKTVPTPEDATSTHELARLAGIDHQALRARARRLGIPLLFGPKRLTYVPNDAVAQVLASPRASRPDTRPVDAVALADLANTAHRAESTLHRRALTRGIPITHAPDGSAWIDPADVPALLVVSDALAVPDEDVARAYRLLVGFLTHETPHTADDVIGHSRKPVIVEIRQVLIHALTAYGATPTQLMRLIHRDHSTVVYSVARAQRRPAIVASSANAMAALALRRPETGGRSLHSLPTNADVETCVLSACRRLPLRYAGAARLYLSGDIFGHAPRTGDAARRLAGLRYLAGRPTVINAICEVFAAHGCHGHCDRMGQHAARAGIRWPHTHVSTQAPPAWQTVRIAAAS